MAEKSIWNFCFMYFAGLVNFFSFCHPQCPQVTVQKARFWEFFAPENFVKFESHEFPILWRKLEVVWITVSYTFVAIAKHCEPPTFVQHLLEKCSFAQHEIFSDGQESSYENMCKIWRKSLWGITLKNGVEVFPCFPYGRQILPPLTTLSNGH